MIQGANFVDSRNNIIPVPEGQPDLFWDMEDYFKNDRYQLSTL